MLLPLDKLFRGSLLVHLTLCSVRMLRALDEPCAKFAASRYGPVVYISVRVTLTVRSDAGYWSEGAAAAAATAAGYRSHRHTLTHTRLSGSLFT